MPSIAETIFCCILLLMIVFIIISIAYYTYIYYSHRTNAIIYKRHWDLLVVFNLLLILSLIGDKVLYMISILITDNMSQAHNHIIYQISDYMYFFLGPTLLLFISCRVWLVYYDLKWTLVANPNDEWTHFIDPQYIDTDRKTSISTNLEFSNNWFIKHQSTLGNSKWMKKFVIIPSTIILDTLLCLSLLIHADIHYYIFCAFCGFLAITIGRTYYLIPKMQIEIFQIKIEIDKMFKVSLSFLSFFAVYTILRTIIVNEKYQFILIIPFQFIFCLHYFFAAIFATRWVLINSQLLQSKNNKSNISSDTSSSADDQSSEENTFWSLHKILRNKLSFNVFMHHLLKEFSSENLLCILEYYQFKLMIIDSHNNVNATDTNTNYMEVENEQLELHKSLIDFRLPSVDIMPRSVIVYDKELSIEDKVNLLVEKYIFNNHKSIKFEVNISSGCKYKIIQKVRNMEQDELFLQEFYNLFDDVIIELERLLNDSHL
eukprot:433737_1